METHRHTKDWLANLASSTQLCKKNMRKNQPWRCLCFGSALQITRMTPSRLTILQLRHNFLTEARTFIFTLRNFSGDQLSAVAFQVRLLQCRLILTGHHQSLHLSHKVHNHDNNVKHTAPKPTRTREGIKYPMSVCAISARNDARKRQNRQVKTGIIGILLANEQVRLQTSASSQTFENML